MATKNNRRILVTRRILKESLLELMKEKPITKISIKEICDLSEMSRSTFYMHYQDQFELLKDIEDEALEKTFETLGSADTSLNSVESIENFLRYVKENRGTFGVLLCQPDTEEFQNLILEKIGAHVKASIPGVYDSKKGSYLFTFVMHGSIDVLRTWIASDFDLEIPALANLIFKACSSVTNL